MMLRPVLVLLLAAAAATAQIQPGDYFIAGSLANMVHIRGSQVTSVPLPPSVSLSTVATPRVIEHVPGTQYVLVAAGTSGPGGINNSYNIHLLDFSNSIASPATSVLLGPLQGTLPVDLDADTITGDLVMLQGGNVLRFAAPVGPGSTMTTVATGQTGTTNIGAVPGANSVYVSSASSTWLVNPGATTPGSDILSPPVSSRNGLAVDPVSGNLYVSRGSTTVGSVDLYTAAGLLLTNVLQAPEVVGVADAKIDANLGLVYTVAPGGSTIGGLPWGVQTGNDNVIVGNTLLGPSAAAQAFGPSTGHGFTSPGVRIVVVRDLTPGLPLAAVTSVGTGCSGTGGLTPVLSTNGLPVLGSNTFSFQISNAAPVAPLYLFVATGTGPPVPVSGACFVYLDLVTLYQFWVAGVNPFVVFGTDPSGSAMIPVPVPSDPGAAGVMLAFQALIVDAGGAPPGFTLTNALECTLGL